MSDVLEKISNPRIAVLVAEYKDLSRLPSLSKANELRLAEILELSISDEVLDFAISEVEHIIGHEFDVLDMKKIGDDQALLRERIGTDIPEIIPEVIQPVDENVPVNTFTSEACKSLKKNLSSLNGPYLCPSI